MAVQPGEVDVFDAVEDLLDELQAAGRWWRRYVAAAPKPELSLASLAAQLYSPDALNEPKQAEQAVLIVAQSSKNPNNYLQVVQFAALAGDSRTADLATQARCRADARVLAGLQCDSHRHLPAFPTLRRTCSPAYRTPLPL